MPTIIHNKKIISIILVALILLTIPLTLYLTQQEQDIRQEAARPTLQNGLVQVGGNVITKNDLQEKIDKVYRGNPTDQTSLQPLLDELVEEELLRQAASTLNLSVNGQDVREKMNEKGIASIDSESTLSNEVNSDVLKEKISKKVAKTREAFTVGFWIPPKNYDVPLTQEQKELIQKQREEAGPALTIIEERMKKGDNPVDIARGINQQFPSLQPIIAVNGYILATTQNQSLFQQPILYEFEKNRANVAYFKKLFEASQNQVIVVKDTGTNDGGSVIRVVSATNGSYNNYKEWLNDQKAKRVKRF